jgi:hypothetical protein
LPKIILLLGRGDGDEGFTAFSVIVPVQKIPLRSESCFRFVAF